MNKAIISCIKPSFPQNAVTILKHAIDCLHEYSAVIFEMERSVNSIRHKSQGHLIVYCHFIPMRRQFLWKQDIVLHLSQLRPWRLTITGCIDMIWTGGKHSMSQPEADNQFVRRILKHIDRPVTRSPMVNQLHFHYTCHCTVSSFQNASLNLAKNDRPTPGEISFVA